MTDIADTVWQNYICQATATIKYIIAYARDAVRDCHTFKSITARKCGIPNATNTCQIKVSRKSISISNNPAIDKFHPRDGGRVENRVVTI